MKKAKTTDSKHQKLTTQSGSGDSSSSSSSRGQSSMPNTSKEIQLWQACTNGDYESARRLLGDPMIDVNFRDEHYKRTPFYRACFFGNTAIVAMMLHDPRVDVNQQQSEGATPFKAACQEGRTSVVELLLHQKIKHMDYNRAQQQGESPFFTACQNGHIEVVKLLLKNPNINVNQEANDGATPIWVAAQEGFLELIKVLLSSKRTFDLEKMPRLNDSIWGGKTATEWAAIMSHTEVSELLDQYGENPNLIRRKLIKELKLPDYYIPLIYATVILFSDEYLIINKKSTNEKAKRFFSLSSRLPIELQMVLSNRVFASESDYVSADYAEDAFKEIFAAFLQEQ